jgi:site-specific DNA-cytosine methylase
VVDKDGRTSAATFHSISRIDDDIVRFRTFVENKDFDRLTDLCHEKYMLARDSQESLRWRKDYAIVKALQGKYGEALKVLMDAHFLASQVTGSTRGKYEDECGIVLVEFGRPLLAIDRFDLALEHHRGDALACGQVWNNKAVALDVLGEPSKALRCVASSIELLTPTGDIVSLEETRRDGDEDIGKATARAIRTLQSPNFSLENVWGYREFESFRIILRALEESGYAFGYWHLNAANYGVPQTRKRLILIASRTHRPRKPQATHSERGPSAQSDLFSSEPLRKWVGWYEAIEDLIPTLPESKFAEWQLKRLPESIKTFIAHPTADCDWFMTRDGDEPVFSILANGNGTPRAFLAHGTSTMEIRDASEPSACVLATVHGKAAKPRAFIVGQNYGSPNDNGKERKLNVRDAGEPIFTVETNPNRLNTRAFLVGGKPTLPTRRAAEGVRAYPNRTNPRATRCGTSVYQQRSHAFDPARDWLSQGVSFQ